MLDLLEKRTKECVGFDENALQSVALKGWSRPAALSIICELDEHTNSWSPHQPTETEIEIQKVGPSNLHLTDFKYMQNWEAVLCLGDTYIDVINDQ